MSPAVAVHLRHLIAYPEHTAGGLMTTRLILARPEDRASTVRAKLAQAPDDCDDLDSVVLVDDDGCLVDDVRILELLLASDEQQLDELASSSAPITVDASAPLDQVVERLTDSRRSSLLVVDEEQRPVGRILADDIIDALVSPRGRHGLHVHLS
jgi:Mg/Co/Ni transporter MgtE